MVRIFVAGHRGMVGSAICRQLARTNAEVVTVSRDELDLTDQTQTAAFFGKNKLVKKLFTKFADKGLVN